MASYAFFYFDYTATFFSAGILTALTYGNRLATLSNDMLIMPIANTVTPLFSNIVSAQNRSKSISEAFIRVLTVIWALVIPISFFLATFSLPIVQVVFQWGEFSFEDSEVASNALMYFSVGIFGYALNAIGTRLIYALEETLWLSVSAVVVSLANIFATMVLSDILGYIGIPIARSVVVGLISTTFVLILIKHYLKDFSITDLFIPLIGIVLSSIFVLTVPFLFFYYKSNLLLVQIDRLIFLSVSILWCLVLYFRLLHWFGVTVIRDAIPSKLIRNQYTSLGLRFMGII